MKITDEKELVQKCFFLNDFSILVASNFFFCEPETTFHDLYLFILRFLCFRSGQKYFLVNVQLLGVKVFRLLRDRIHALLSERGK